MTAMIAFCGLDCAQCDAYVATQASDFAGLERIAEKWRVEFNAPDMTPESIMCDGCLSLDGRLAGYCSMCEIRHCGIEHSVSTCAGCGEYACEKLEAFIGGVPAARENLERLRSAG